MVSWMTLKWRFEMDGTVTITKDEYLKLRIAERELQILNGAGVDNWEGYGSGFEFWEDEQSEIEEEIKKL